MAEWLNQLETVIYLGIITALYDFAYWFGINREISYETAKETGNDKLARRIIIFRICKEITDLIILPLVCILSFNVSWNVIGAYYIAKWFHLSDSFYNIYRFIWTNQPVAENGNWRWWTPLGLLRSIRITRGKFHFEKANVTIKECWYQTAIGLIFAAILIILN